MSIALAPISAQAKAAAQALEVIEPVGRALRLVDTSYADSEIINSAGENVILATAVMTGGGHNAVGVRC